MQQINLLISIDDGYIDRAIDMLRSITFHNDCFLNVYFIYNKIKDETINKLKEFLVENKIGELKPVYFDTSSIDFPVTINYISVVTYYRLFAPFIIEDKIDRLLYLDCDIICTGSIIDFYNTDFGDSVIVGCRNLLKSCCDYDEYNRCIRQNIGLKEDDEYINAGVLLINIKEYKNFTNSDVICKFIRDNYDHLLLQDQDVINGVFHEKIMIGDQKYNYQINAIDYGKETFDNCLVHYSESFKPWNLNYNSLQKAIPYYEFLRRKGDIETLDHLLEKHSFNYSNLLYFLIVNYYKF